MQNLSRGLSAVAAAAFITAAVATPAMADRVEQVGQESGELSQALAWFNSPRYAPNQAVPPGAFPSAASYAASTTSVNSTAWTELGPYSYFPDNRRYIDPVWSNSGSGSGFNTGRITAVAVAPDGTVFVGAAGGGVWRSTDSAHQQWTPVFDHQRTTAIGALAIVPGQSGGYTVYAGTGEPTVNLDSYAGIGVLAS